MYRTALAVCCSLVVLVPAVPVVAGVFPYEVHRSTLDNGLEVILIPMPSEGLVSYWSIVRTGSRDEIEPGVTGFAHFFEHMMFRGSETISADEYERIVASMGADSNAFTSNDITAYHLSVTTVDLPRVIEIESDRFRRLALEESTFRTEAGAVYGEYRKNRTSPHMVLLEALSEAAFDVHTYRHTTMGFEADIRRMPEQFEYAKSFFRRFYRPENVVLLVAGDFDVAATAARIEAAYGGWKPGYVEPQVPLEPEQTAPRRLTIPFEGQTLPILAIAFKGEKFAPEDPTATAASLIDDLAFGETSPLYKKLVLDEQRVQSLFTFMNPSRDPGLWVVFAMVRDPKDVWGVESEILSVLEELRSTPVAAGRLDDARSRRKYGFLSGLSTPDEVASSLARIVAITGGIGAVDELAATLESVTPADVQRAAQRYFTPRRSTTAVLHSADRAIPPLVAANPPVELPVAVDPNVSIDLWFRVGSQDDPPGKEGLTSLTAAMITDGGTARRSLEEVLSRLSPLAADYSGSVDKEMTMIGGVVHRDVAPRFVAQLTESLVEPGFRDEDFQRLKANRLTTLEKQLRYSSDEELGKAVLYEEVFVGTPYRHHALGSVAGLKSITLDEVKEHFRRHFTRENVTLGIGGAYDEALRDRLVAALGRLPSGTPVAVAAPQPAPIEGRRVTLVEKPGESTAISFGVPIGVHRGSAEFYALWLANSWLGEHRNSVSRLYQVIRETRGMNYGDYSYIEAFPLGGFRNMPPTGVGRRQQLFEVWIRPVPEERAVFALRAALREIDRLVREGLTQEQLDAHRAFLGKYSYQFATTTGERLGYAIDDRFYGIDGEGHLARFRERMAELTLDEVNTAIRKHLSTRNLQIAMVTANAAAVKEALVSDAPSPIDYGGLDKPAEVLEEDRAIERYPLDIAADAVRIVPVEEVFAH